MYDSPMAITKCIIIIIIINLLAVKPVPDGHFLCLPALTPLPFRSPSPPIPFLSLSALHLLSLLSPLHPLPSLCSTPLHLPVPLSIPRGDIPLSPHLIPFNYRRVFCSSVCFVVGLYLGLLAFFRNRPTS